MDYDDDGILDMISGSYDPGDIWLFRGLGEGRYDDRLMILDEKKVRLVHHPEELVRFEATDPAKRNEREAIGNRVASFGSWPAMVDWDGDGDLDMLIGTFEGTLYRRMNTGSRAEPVWIHASTQVAASEGPIDVGMHAAPVVADWDGDGRWDLVVGAGDGSVSWFRNTGTEKAPAFGERQILIEAKATSKFLTQYLGPKETPRPGVRAQICVTDYDGDGKLDLLLGDYSSNIRTRKQLSPSEKKRLEELLDQESDLSRSEDPDRKEKLAAIAREKKKLADGESSTQSFVWLFLRNAPR